VQRKGRRPKEGNPKRSRLVSRRAKPQPDEGSGGKPSVRIHRFGEKENAEKGRVARDARSLPL